MRLRQCSRHLPFGVTADARKPIRADRGAQIARAYSRWLRQYMYGVFKNIAPQMLAATRSPQELLVHRCIHVTCEANEGFPDAGLRAVGEANVLCGSDLLHELESLRSTPGSFVSCSREDLSAAGRAGIAGRSAAHFYCLA